MKRTIFMVLLSSVVLAFTAQSAIAGWYKCKVLKVIGRSYGDIILQVGPGEYEAKFTETSRVQIDEEDTGSTRNLAVVLTAVAMDQEIEIDVANVPSWGEIQSVSSIGVITQ